MKKHMKKLLLSLLVIVGIIASGCFAKKPDIKNNTSKNGIEAVAEYGEKVATTRNLQGEEEILSVEGTIVEDVLTISDNLSLNNGDILLVKISEKENVVAKEILEKISSNKYRVQDAEMEDVFNNLDMKQEVQIVEDSLKENSLPKGIRLVSDNDYARSVGIINSERVPEGLKYSVNDYVIYQDGDNALKVSANILLKTPKVNFDFSFRRRYMELTLDVGDSAKIDFIGNINQKVEGKIDLGVYSIPLSAWGVPLGNIDVALSMVVRADGKVDFEAKLTQDLDYKFGIQGEFFRELEVVNNISLPESASDYLTFGMKSNGGVELASGMYPSISYTLLQYKIVELGAEAGLNAKSNHELVSDSNINDENLDFGVNAKYKAEINPYLLLKWAVIGFEPNSTDLLADKDWTFEVEYTNK